MNISVNALRSKRTIRLIAYSIVFISLACGTVWKKDGDNPQDEIGNTGSHEVPVSASCKDERNSAISIHRSAPSKACTPTKLKKSGGSSVSLFASFNQAGLDVAGHMRVFYLDESRFMKQRRIRAVLRIESGEYLEAATHLRLAVEKGMEALVAHYYGNEGIKNKCSGNIALCGKFLDPDLVNRLNLSMKLLNGVVHAEPYYENMSKERIMASVNTLEMLEEQVRACAR